MIKKIILENFMSHVHTVIEPAAGLTVLIGPNNCGKSAITHALEMICCNPDAVGYVIRHGEKKASVTIELEDEAGKPHVITWWRKHRTAGYIIDDREISGMGMPQDLHEYLRMPVVQAAAGKQFNLHFGLQRDPIFLLNDPPAWAAQFFATTSDADHLMAMQKQHKQNESNARRDKEWLDKDIAKLDGQLGELASLPGLGDALSQLESSYRQINEDSLNLLDTEREIGKWQQAVARAQLHKAQQDELGPLQNPPLLEHSEPLVNHIRSLAIQQTRAAENAEKIAALQEMMEFPHLPESVPLEQLVERLQQARRRFEAETHRVNATTALAGPPALDDDLSLDILLARMNEKSANAGGLASSAGALRLLQMLPPLDDPLPMKQQIEKLELAVKRSIQQERRCQVFGELKVAAEEESIAPLAEFIDIADRAAAKTRGARRLLEQADSNLAQLHDQIAAFVKDNPRCPTCNQEVNADAIMSPAVGSHAHE